MRRFSHYRVRRLHARHIWTGGWKIWAPASLYLLGILIGTVATVQSAYLTQFAKRMTDVYISENFAGVAGFCFLSALFLQALVLFFSFSCVGTPAILLTGFLKGFSYGSVCGYLCSAHRWKGILACLLIFWASQFLQAVLLFWFSARAIALSQQLYKLNLTMQKEVQQESPQTCLTLFFKTSGALIFPALLTAGASLVFGPVLLVA